MIKCPNCATENKDQWKFCLGCGSELPREQVAAAKRFTTPTPPAGVAAPAFPAAPPAPPAAPAAAPVAAPAAAAAPPSAPVAAPAAAPPAGACPQCGNHVPSDNIFCGRCGYRMDQAAAAPPAPPAAPAPSPGGIVRGRLVLLQPDGSEGDSIPLVDGSTPVGRQTHEVLAGDPFLSPHHMRFDFQGGQLVVHDENSTNGIYVRLVPNVPVSLQLGDSFRLGQEYLLLSPLQPIIPDASGTVAMGTGRETAWGRLDQILGPGLIGEAYLCRGDQIILGRERGNVLFPEDGYVSGAHMEIRRQGDSITITDLQSSNGTYVRVRGERVVTPNEILLVGQYLYRVEY